ncbi:hypothetical protein VCHC17A1_3905B, partial [Vibrio cholerae HC-17A1]
HLLSRAKCHLLSLLVGRTGHHEHIVVAFLTLVDDFYIFLAPTPLKSTFAYFSLHTVRTQFK